MRCTKIISWNIGGLFSNRDSFLRLAGESGADFICIQESKANNQTMETLRPERYHVLASESERSVHQGSAIYYRNEPVLMTRHAPPCISEEGRFQCLDYDDFCLINAYMPNAGNNKKFLSKKVKSLEWLISVAKTLDKRKPTIICGDMNVGRYYKEEVRRKARNSRSGFTSEEKHLFNQLLDLGFIDVVVHQYPNEGDIVSYLDNKSGKSDISDSYRLDYILVSERLKNQIISVDILTEYERHNCKHLPIELVISL